MEYKDKGELKLCPEGQRLLDEYTAILEILHYQRMEVGETDTSTEMSASRVWDKYTSHRLECKECRFV